MRQAVILAGGQAFRMRPYTEGRPKAMVEIAGKPIIEHQLGWLSKNGVEQVVVSAGPLAKVIQDHVKDGSRFGLRVDYAVEDQPLGRGGGLRFAAQRLADRKARWFGLNGDVITYFPLDELESHHQKLGVLATIALAPYESNWGVAELDGDLIRGFIEKPKLDYWINAGIYCMEPEVVDFLPEEGDHEESTFPRLAETSKLGGYRIHGYWRGIDTVKDVQKATAELEGM